MTEDEAKTKYCPVVTIEHLHNDLRVDGSVAGTVREENMRPCIASSCMWWRAGNKPEDGYCGAGGKP